MILACALLHNFIHREMEVDSAKARIYEDHREFYNDDLPTEVEYVATIDPSNEWGIIQMDASGSFTTSFRGRKPVVCRRMWTISEEDALVQALEEILTSGWKADNGFRVGYLNVLQDKIMKLFPTTDLRAQPHINSDEQWEAACKTEPMAHAMRWKSWPYYDSWKLKHNPQSPPVTNLEDIDTPDSPLAEEVATTPVCEPSSRTTTKPASKGKSKLSEGIVGPIMEGLNNFTEKTDSRLGDIIGKMGHGHELTRKCEKLKHNPQSPPATNLEDIDTPDSPLAEEVATTPVCEPSSSTTTKPASKGKIKLSEGIVGPIMEGLNNFIEKMDSRLGDIIGKMGHEHELTRKCESVYHIVNEIPDLTLDDKLVATNMIFKNPQVLTMFYSLPQEAQVGQVRLMLAGKI
ncbi:hypothetical protein BUALT_Bualt09G0004100 [Buddleja alternifolia]|uniref:Retrotransposon protein n=1 Tax=Buddleja alternifolia TaxID=168488 RepID=A0AAV6X9Q0_9LAMI|nr:hypothetical protein BUALT_Bualt09G0004100 [Buddleja alternifolia]